MSTILIAYQLFSHSPPVSPSLAAFTAYTDRLHLWPGEERRKLKSGTKIGVEWRYSWRKTHDKISLITSLNTKQHNSKWPLSNVLWSEIENRCLLLAWTWWTLISHSLVSCFVGSVKLKRQSRACLRTWPSYGRAAGYCDLSGYKNT